ncbi:MAG TPA: CHASE3 domain-containing protein [Herpetosiphonaceae bacterium]
MTQFNNLSIRTQVLLVSSVMLIIVVIMAALVYNEIMTAQAREQEVVRTFEIVSSTDAMLLQLVNMQTGYRGYLFNGNPVFLEPYNAGRASYTLYQDRLQKLVQDNPPQVERLKQIDRNVRDWNNQNLKHGIELREQVDLSQIRISSLDSFVSTGREKLMFDNVRAQIAWFRGVETTLLQQRNEEAVVAANRLIATLVGSTILALIIGLSSAIAISGNIARRVSLVAQAATNMAQGDLLVRCQVPPSRDEVGRMSAAFNSMADTIQQRTNDLEAKNHAIQQASERQQQLFETVQQLSTPLLPVLDGLVVLPIVGHIDTRRADDIMRTLLHGVAQQKARVAILDVTGIATLDTHVIMLLLQAIQATELLGARVLLAGITAPMAQVIITQGIDLRHLRTYKDLRSAIESVLIAQDRNGAGPLALSSRR